MKNTLYIALGIGALAACKTGEEVVNSDVVVNPTEKPKYETIDISYLDDNTKPQDDFFQFSNGTWIKENPVPPSESRWGSFNELEKSNNEKLTTILEQAKLSKSGKGTDFQILGDYYASFMNMDVRNKQGLSAIEKDIQGIDVMNSKKDITLKVADLHKLGVRALFGFGVGQDLKNVDYHISYLGQGGIGLPNRDYYFEESKKDILEAYRKHIIRIGEMLGMTEEDATQWMTDVVNLEVMLAEHMMRPAEMRNPETTYNKFSKKDVQEKLGFFDFDTYLSNIGSQSFDTLILSNPKFVDEIGKLVQEIDLPIWKSYLKWKLVNHFAGHLDESFVQANFDFYGTVLSGTKEMKPMNERAIREITSSEFSELLGKAFVDRHFSAAAKNRVNGMVDNLLAVYKTRIEHLDWMSDVTKEQALTKLNAIGRKLGFPDKWEDFTKLDFTPTNYIGNIKNEARFSHIKNMAKLSEPVDKEEWGMPAHMVNAYYHPLLNEIAFPAGIMQAPFFSNDYEDAVNYGRMGMVIGHEFTHGFDDMGSKFAADGSFMNWWTEDDRAMFEERTEKLGATFAGFCPIEGHCVNPELTMGENIADLGGLTMAYYAYSMTDEFKSGKAREGYTPAQRFFISYAQLWKINYTEEELKNRIANDPHSPGMYRVNGPLMNCPEFFDAFKVEEGQPMRNSSDKISKIW